MNYALLLVFGCSMVLSCALGYFLGRRVGQLSAALDKLKKQPHPEPPSTGITMGAYNLAPKVSNSTSSATSGVVETKTPERLAFEAEEKIKKQALGIK